MRNIAIATSNSPVKSEMDGFSIMDIIPSMVAYFAVRTGDRYRIGDRNNDITGQLVQKPRMSP